VERFFVFYNEQRQVRFEPLGRRGAREAERLLRAGMRDFAA
jgi:hypothetical protein